MHVAKKIVASLLLSTLLWSHGKTYTWGRDVHITGTNGPEFHQQVKQGV